MIETIAEVQLPVNETLRIQRNRLLPEGYDKNSDLSGLKRISIVTGIHGDELEGQYVCYEIQRKIREHRDCLRGIVDIYPAMNPLGIDSITRGIPDFDLDLNRLFPGSGDGDMPDHLASSIISAVLGSSLVFDIHASNIYLTEIPQIRINELHRDWLVPMARGCNVDLIWVHGASTVLESTFAYSLNTRGTPVLVVEMGVGMRITQSIGEQLVNGILNEMKELGVWTGETIVPRDPILSDSQEDVIFLNARTSGVFLADAKVGAMLRAGDPVGRLVNPLDGALLETVRAPEAGLLFTIREYPVVSEGSLMGRMIRKRAVRRIPAKEEAR